jgi:hypothetical protein
MKLSRTLLVGMVLAASTAALAQYSWRDSSGHRVFSDQPPPGDVPEKDMLSRPRATATVIEAAPAAPDASAPASAPAPAASAPSGVDKTLEEKKKQAEAEEAAKKQAEEQRQAAARADNCKRAMNYKNSLDSGQRIARMNDKTGEREILDDAQRAAEQQRVQQAINQNCN